MNSTRTDFTLFDDIKKALTACATDDDHSEEYKELLHSMIFRLDLMAMERPSSRDHSAEFCEALVNDAAYIAVLEARIRHLESKLGLGLEGISP